MNSAVLYNIARFILLLLAQVAIFNEMQFFGYLNAYPYVLFILLYPVNGNKYGILLSSFLLGFLMDLFCNSGGVHATACISLAYLRPTFLKFAFGVSYEYQTIKINDKLSSERFSFLLVCILFHHFTLFVLETFKWSFFFGTLLKTFCSSLFTTLLCILLIYLFKPTKR